MVTPRQGTLSINCGGHGGRVCFGAQCWEEVSRFTTYILIFKAASKGPSSPWPSEELGNRMITSKAPLVKDLLLSSPKVECTFVSYGASFHTFAASLPFQPSIAAVFMAPTLYSPRWFKGLHVSVAPVAWIIIVIRTPRMDDLKRKGSNENINMRSVFDPRLLTH